MKVTALAAGKVNLGWRVGARRDDGYHDVSGHIHTISLHDELVIEPDDSLDEPVALSVPGHPDLEDDDNLVLVAARLLLDRARSPRPVRITLRKQIPVGAGLGGGSADAAAALTALNVLWKTGLAPADLVACGAEVGSDVPALVLGGLVHVSGRGERIRGVGHLTGVSFLLGVGPERIAAADAYAAFDEHGGGDDGSLVHNDLARAAGVLVPDLEARLAAMRAVAPVVFVSGSGPTVVGVVPGDDPGPRPAGFTAVHVATPTKWGVRIRVGE